MPPRGPAHPSVANDSRLHPVAALWAIGHDPRRPQAVGQDACAPRGRVVLWVMWAIENKLPTLPTGMRAWAFVGNVGNVVMEKKLIQPLQMRVTYSYAVRLYSTYNFYTVK
jgi:hypothetical protein